MAGISEEMRRKMRVDRQKGHVQAGNASWKGDVIGGESMTHDMTSGCSDDVYRVWFGRKVSYLPQTSVLRSPQSCTHRKMLERHIFKFINEKHFLCSYLKEESDHAVRQSYHRLEPVDGFAMLWHRRPLRWQCRIEHYYTPTTLSKCSYEGLPEQVLHHTLEKSSIFPLKFINK